MNLHGAAAAELHDVTDVIRFSARSDEQRHVVVIQFLQLYAGRSHHLFLLIDNVNVNNKQ